MLLNEKTLANLTKYAEKDLNKKISEIKLYSVTTLKKELDNIQIAYEHEDYSYFADLSDEIISNNSNDDYKEYFSTSYHLNNVEKLSKILTEIYIKNVLKLVDNTYENIESKFSCNEEIEKVKLIKEKEFLTTDEVSLIYQLKKDKLLELRTKKHLKYFQLEENSKVLFSKKEVEDFMRKNTF